MTDEPQKVALRLAFRVEDSWWVAYFAKAENMDGAVEVGRVRMEFVIDADRCEAFKQIMLDGLEDHLTRLTGINKLDWTEMAPPEHESGNA